MNFCPKCAAALIDRELERRTRRACPAEGCGFTFYENPTPVVAAILEHEGGVVLVRNKGWPEKMFGLVSGFLEKGESPEEGVLREVKEEVGLDATLVRLVGVYPFELMNQVIIAYHLTAEGTLLVGEELEGARHVSKEKLRPWPWGTGQAVTEWLRANGRTDV